MTPDDHADERIARRLAGTPALVTGGAGFIGSHIAQALVRAGAEVRVLDDLSTGHRENLPDGATFIEGSILEGAALAAAVRGCRYVFHEAAMVSVAESVREPGRCVEINVEGTGRVLAAAHEAGAERVVFASSAAVYGDEPALPSREDHPVDPRSPYAASKIAGELLLTTWARCFGRSTVSLRYFNVFGPRQDPKSPYAAVISAFTDALLNGRRPVIHGDGGQTRDFVHVDDVVRANLLAATHERRLDGEVFNIGSGRSISIRTLLATLASILGVDVDPETQAARPGDVRDSRADVGRAREVLGYAPAGGLEDGLRRHLDAVRSAAGRRA